MLEVLRGDPPQAHSGSKYGPRLPSPRALVLHQSALPTAELVEPDVPHHVTMLPMAIYADAFIRVWHRAFREVVASCLQRDPKLRPTSQKLRSNKAFSVLK
jgi:hypothetical protein